MPTITRADWSSVTLAEYAALHMLMRDDLEDRMNAWWDHVWEHNPFRGERPTRLNPEAHAWLYDLQNTVRTTLDEHEQIRVAREFTTAMGTLLVMGVDRTIRMS